MYKISKIRYARSTAKTLYSLHIFGESYPYEQLPDGALYPQILFFILNTVTVFNSKAFYSVKATLGIKL